MRWYENHRQEWINETLKVFGYINREHLIRKFSISVPQASKDLNRFLRLHPGTMVYDTRSKRYIALSFRGRLPRAPKT